MPRFVTTASLFLALLQFSATSQAQFFAGGNTNDPFFQYYGFYLPRQAALAAQPRPQDSINAIAAARQYSALTERAGLYDPIQPFGTYDPSSLFGGGRGSHYGGMARHGSNINGAGPGGYYGRTHTYYPGLRTGRTTAPSAQSFRPRGRVGPSMPAMGGIGLGGGMPTIPGR